MPKRISAADATPDARGRGDDGQPPRRCAGRARGCCLRAEMPGLELMLHAADEWGGDAAALAACHADIARGDIVIATMLFLDDHIRAVLPALTARRDDCDAMLCCLSAGEVVRLTRLGSFDMAAKPSGAIALLKRLRGEPRGGGSSGRGQMKMLRQLPRLLRFIPGTAQDVRAYFLALQYWLAGSEENLANLVRLLVDRYADGARAHLAGAAARRAAGRISRCRPVPSARARHAIVETARAAAGGGRSGHGRPAADAVLRAVRQSAHYDGVIAALEARGLRVIPAFASGLDARPAIERYFMQRRHGHGRCGGFADRLLAGRRPRLQRCPRRRGTAGGARCALYRGASGRIPDAGAMAGRSRAD